MLPPSANHAFPSSRSGGRYKSDAYKQFQKDCQPYMKGYVEGDVEVEYNFLWKDKRRRDIMNFEKCLTDTLVDYGVIDDDSHIKRMVIEYHHGEPETRIMIKPYEHM